jgi:hypothetical protein
LNYSRILRNGASSFGLHVRRPGASEMVEGGGFEPPKA